MTIKKLFSNFRSFSIDCEYIISIYGRNRSKNFFSIKTKYLTCDVMSRWICNDSFIKTKSSYHSEAAGTTNFEFDTQIQLGIIFLVFSSNLDRD